MTKLLAALLLAVSLPAAAELNCGEKGLLAYYMAVDYDSYIQFQTMNHRTLNEVRANQQILAMTAKQTIAEFQVRDDGLKTTKSVAKLINTVYTNAGTVNSVAISETVKSMCKRGEI